MEARVDPHRALVEAGIALTSELSLESVLRKLLETAAALTRARFAALGVIDPVGTGLERFLVTGIDVETEARIGEPPRGRGILGLLIRDAKPVRLRDLGEDPRSVGFPPGHPPMRSFLGVPILLRGVAYGNLYLTEKEEAAEFTQEDEEIGCLLAAQAAVAIENARLYESATRWLRQLESLNEVGNALAEELDLPRLLDLVVSRLRELIAARVVMIVLPTPEGGISVEAVAGGRELSPALDLHLAPEGSKTGHVLRRRRSERGDSLIDDPEIDQGAIRILGVRTGLWVPLIVRDEAIGVIVAHDKVGPDPRFSEDDQRLAENFAARAAVAVDLSKRVARDSLRRVLEAQELERRRLSRELHDETGQQLTSILLGLHAVEEAKSPDEAKEAAASLRQLIVTTLQDVRRLAVDLRPKALDDFGLVPALQRLGEAFTDQTGIAVEIEARLPEKRLPGEIETVLYRVTQEALTNVVKHARARSVSILLTTRNGGVALVIEDDGVGLTPGRVREDALGLVGMRERVALVGGRIEFESGLDAGTSIRIEVPLS